MPLHFPEVDDIPLGRPPLREVICQVRFPPVLLIAKQMPTDLQECLRKEYPNLAVERPVQIATDNPLAEAPLDARPPVFRFRSRDEKSMVSLSTGFYTVSTQAYTHWAAFAVELERATQAVRETYDITYATRIGLRYINVVSDEHAEGATLGMYDLLRPELTALLRTAPFRSPSLALTQVKTSEGEDQLTFRYGLGECEGFSQLAFVLDFDLYAQGELDFEGLLERCDRYHSTIYRAFRWCLSDTGFAAFEPVY
jgi:uncharacterized protein (TIGR04255 family)